LERVNVQTANAGNYSVVVSNAVGSAVSNTAVLALGTAIASSGLGTPAAGQNPTADSDGDGIPDLTEAALGVSAHAAPSADSGNATNLKVQRPPQ